MRRISADFRPSLSACGGWFLALSLAASASAQGPSTKKAAAVAPPDTSPLARYVPRDGLFIHFEFSGLDAHAAAWQKTAAYRMLNETPLGEMLEDLGTQLADKALALRPAHKLSGAEVVQLVKHLARSGFVVAISHGGKDNPDHIHPMMVIRGATRRDVRAVFGRLLGSFAGPGGKPQMVKMGGERSVVIMPGASPTASWAWWSEKNDLVITEQKSKGKDMKRAEAIIEVLDGKRPNAVDHPVRVELAKARGTFQPIGLGFLIPIELPSTAEDLKKVLAPLGLGGVERIEYQWGLEDVALMSVTRVMAPPPRQGILGLYDQPTFEKGALPPLPEGITGFRVVSLDLPKSLDTVLALARSLGGSSDSLAQNSIELFKEKTRLDLRKDLLAHLGPKMAFYVAEGKTEDETSEEGPDAGSAFEKLAGGLNLKSVMAAAVSVPKFTLVVEVGDAEALGKAVDQLMVQVNKGLKEWRVAELDKEEEAKEKLAAGPGAAKSKRGTRPSSGSGTRRSTPTAPEFRLMTGPTKAYVLNMPSDMPRLPGGLRPTIRLGAKHIVVSVSPDAAKQALEQKPGEWAPPADLKSTFERLPPKLVSLSIIDPRPTLPEFLASLPATLQKTINTAIVQAQAKATAPPTPPASGDGPRTAQPQLRPSGPPPGYNFNAGSAPFGAAANANQEAATITLEVDPAKMPSADALKALLFPGSSSVSVDDRSIQFIRREAFPNVGLTSPAILLGLAMPAIQSARDAARKAAEKAGAPASAPAPAPGAAPGPGAPRAAPPSQRRSAPR